MDYLRASLGLPDASERKEGELKWALVTEPHLCRGVLRSVLSFFDVVVTVAAQSDDVDTTLRLPDVLKYVVGGNNMKRENKKVVHTEQHIMGNFKRPYAQEEGILYWSKMIKVTAMARVSPFKMTIFNDMDNIPCHADFARLLLRTYGLGGKVAGGQGMDIATLPTRVMPLEHRRNASSNKWFFEQYYGKGRPRGAAWAAMRSATNTHSSRVVVLNITSPQTLKFLERYYFGMAFAFMEEGRGHLPIHDQPYFGLAGLAMQQDSIAGGGRGTRMPWKDVDMLEKHLCTKPEKCGDLKNSCLAVHKMMSPS